MLFRKCNFSSLLFFALTLLFFNQTASSAELANPPFSSAPETQTLPSTRPKIGLVLSGGGARGFAHIGVLKILEQNRIPIDYIVGTSMGSIVGGLYAIGLSPEEIEHGVSAIAWDKVFDDFAYRQYKTFRRKQDDFDFFSIHRVGINETGLQLSPGLIEGQQIELALDRLAHPGFHINDYDNLRIPFRAIATNIENGQPFIIQTGNIAQAMRASMSIPGVLPPVKIDNTLLVDGGIANNIAIDVARNMGADIIIAVDVSAPLSRKQNLKSSVEITAQLVTILTRRIADIQIKSLSKNDILITPSATEIASSEFIKHAELITAGELAALAKLDAIQKLSLSDAAYSAHLASLPNVARKEPIIHSITIKNQTRLQDAVMSARIRQSIGEPLNVLQLEQDLSHIYGLDFSSSVVYSLQQHNGKTELIIYVRDRGWAHSYLQFGLSIQSESDIGAFTNFDIAFTKNDLNSLAGEFRASLGVGSEPGLSVDLYQPLNVELDLFISAKAGIETMIFPVVSHSNIDSIERFRRSYIDLSTGKIFNQSTKLSFGFRFSDGRASTISGNRLFSADNFQEGAFYASLLHDSLDSLSFPNTGFFGGLTFKSSQENLGADSSYEQLQLMLSSAKTYQRYSVFSRVIFETTLNENAPVNALYRRGGFLELSGTLQHAVAGQHFGLVQAVFYRRLGDITFLPIYAGFSVEAGNAWDRYKDINTNNTTLASSLFIGADTFLGPLYLAFGFTDNGEQAVYFNLGKTFLAR